MGSSGIVICALGTCWNLLIKDYSSNGQYTGNTVKPSYFFMLEISQYLWLKMTDRMARKFDGNLI